MLDLKPLQNGSDIRGVASEGGGQPVNLTDEAVYALAGAFAAWLRQRTGKAALRIGIGRDSRISGERIAGAVCDALCAAGAQVFDTGLASTPAMFMTTVTEGFAYDGAMMITASHLPWNRNGLKFFTPAGGLEKQEITALISLAEADAQPAATRGSVTTVDFMPVYAKQLADKVRAATGKERPLAGCKIVVDAGNGAGGFYVKQVLTPLGADTTGSLYLEPDGRFPNHIPNPEDQAAMQAIAQAVQNSHADFGIIFDTDVDRAAAVDHTGRFINRNRLIALISAILLEETPGTTIVTDSVTSSGLAEFIARQGGIHRRFKRGYKNVINEAVRLNAAGQNAQLAIETSGHGALKENYFLDDGAYLVTKLLIKLAQLGSADALASLITDLREPAEACEVRLPILAQDFRAYGNEVIQHITTWAESDPRCTLAPDNCEGVRVNLLHGWFLLRLSLHDPLLPLNVESDVQGEVKSILQALAEALRPCTQLDMQPLQQSL